MCLIPKYVVYYRCTMSLAAKARLSGSKEKQKGVCGRMKTTGEVFVRIQRQVEKSASREPADKT